MRKAVSRSQPDPAVLTFERTRDIELIRQVLTHPRLYRHMGDDTAPPAEEFAPNADPRIWYVLARARGELLGILPFVPHSAVRWEVHCAFLPRAWGHTAPALAGGIRWLFEQSTCRRIVASVPRSNRLAARLAQRAGLVLWGVEPAAFLRDGQLVDVMHFGISKE